MRFDWWVLLLCFCVPHQVKSTVHAAMCTTRTHTRTHTHTTQHAHARTHTHTHACTRTHTHACTRMHTHTHTTQHAHAHTWVYVTVQCSCLCSDGGESKREDEQKGLLVNEGAVCSHSNHGNVRVMRCCLLYLYYDISSEGHMMIM